MYSPKYTINNTILKNIGIIEACREVVKNAPMLPAYEKQFREDAIIRTVHHGTHIEGNDLSLDQAGMVLRGFQGETNALDLAQKAGLVARERDVQEIINYRNVMKYLEHLHYQKNQEDFQYTEDQIRQVHKLVVHRLVPEGSRGVYRQTQVVLKDSRTGEITFRPPPAVEVPYLMEDFMGWCNSQSGREHHSVMRAGIAHYALAAIHPFVEGNGRTARAFATLVLFVENYDIKKLFSLEEYFDRDAESYYQSLIVTSNQSKDLAERDLTSWLEYFSLGLSIELARIRDKVRKLSVDSKIKNRHGEQIFLSERQIKIIEYLSDNERGTISELTPLFSMISDDTVLRELQDLTKKDIITRKGKTKGSYYEMVK